MWGDMEDKPTCASCVCFITEDGKPFYCAARDLYTLVEPDDEACDEYAGCRKMSQNIANCDIHKNN